MLFWPFAVQSVETISAEMFEASGSGVLCARRRAGRVRLGDCDVILDPGNGLFLYSEQPTELEMEHGEAPLFWIRIKINHVDLRHMLSGVVFSFPYKDAFLDFAARAAAGDAAAVAVLEQMVNLHLTEGALERTSGRKPSGGMAHAEDGLAPPDFKSRYEQLYLFLDQHMQYDFSIAELAAAADCSERQLNAILHRYSACTASEFVNRQRMERAKLLLTTSELTITEIAAVVGIKSIHYFSRIFKKFFGVSPREFRSSAMKDGSK